MKKLYILIRKDLSNSYRTVQAGHAVAEWMLQHSQLPETQEWGNGTLIYLDVEDEKELELWTQRLDRRDIKWVGFREPDIGNQLTTIACLTDSKIFSNLKLFKLEKENE